MICYISVGSNLGNRLRYIKRAISYLKKAKGLSVRKASALYETENWGPDKTQKYYINLILKIDTALSPEKLLFELKRIEKKTGRKKRTVRWSSREVDLDIIFYGKKIIRNKNLTIPHPRLEKRFFVLRPMLDVAPYFKHPATGQGLKILLKALKESTHWRRLDEKIIP